MDIVEKTRNAKTRVIRVRRAEDASKEDENDSLRHQVRRLSERNSRSFDEGFTAAVQMVERGADLEQLRRATGAVSAEWMDTAPIEIIASSPCDTLVDLPALED